MDNLASLADLRKRSLPGTSLDVAAATAAVRDAAGVPISQQTGTLTVMGSRDPWLKLPPPVTAVSAVTIDGEPVSDFKTFPHALYRAEGWQADSAPSVVAVSLTYGYAEVPADVVQLVCDLAAISSQGPKDPRVTSVRVDDAQVSYDPATASLLTIPERTRADLRIRFGGGASFVTGSR